MISDQSLLLSTTVLNDSSYYRTAIAIYNYSARWLYVHKENKSVKPNVLAGYSYFNA